MVEESLCNVEFIKDNNDYIARVQSDIGGLREYRSSSLEEVLEQVIIDLQEEFENAWDPCSQGLRGACMRSSKEGSDYDSIISSYYGDDQVTAMISVKVETKDVDLIAEAISKNRSVDDVYILTGETDIMAMVRFNTYKELKSFLIETDGMPGVKETNTSMVVTTFKRSGESFFEEDDL